MKNCNHTIGIVFDFDIRGRRLVQHSEAINSNARHGTLGDMEMFTFWPHCGEQLLFSSYPPSAETLEYLEKLKALHLAEIESSRSN